MPNIPNAPGPITSPVRTQLVASISQTSPDTLETIFRAKFGVYLTGLTVSNKGASGTTAQCFVGIRLVAESGGTWEPIIPPIVGGGEYTTWVGRVYMSEGDELVSYATVTNVFTITPELGE